MECGSRVKGRVLDYTSDGRAVLREEGVVLFFEGGVIGDLVLVEVTTSKKNYLEGRLIEILEDSKDRIMSDCSVFGTCGGCDYRHVEYSAQLNWKKQFTENALRKIGGFSETVVQDLDGAEERYYYRNNIQLPIRRVNGEVQIGFFAKKSKRVISCEECQTMPREVWKMVLELKSMLESSVMSIFDGEKGILKHLGVRLSPAGQMMVIVVTRQKISSKYLTIVRSLFSDEFLSRHHIVSLFENVQASEDQTFGREWHLLYGKPEMEESICGKSFLLSPASFFQVHRGQAEKLYRRAIEYLDPEPEDTLLDLYCGVGSIGICASDRVKKLIGIEVVPEAIENAKKNALRNGISNAIFYAGKAEKLLSSTLKDFEADVVILDPPRKGAEKEVLQALGIIEPKKIVYVSCNPTTLARDLKILSSYGYRLKKVGVVDMFPMTSHVENIVLLVKP